jgi:hypothetical protein
VIKIVAKSRRSRFRDSILIVLVMLVGFVLRAISIDEPFVDRWSYRQSDVAMVARDFYLFRYDILHPRIDYGGAQPGYVGMEFPAVPFLAAALFSPFGEHDAIGRSVSLAAFLLSVPPLFLLVEGAANKRAAFFAICMYSLMPLTIFCGRSFTSDMAANSLSIWAVWLFDGWIRDRSPGRMAAAALMTSAAILAKATYLVVGLPMAYLALRNFGARAFIRRDLWLFAATALLPSVAWYSHAAALTRENYPHIAFLGHPDYFLTVLPIRKYVRIAVNTMSWLTPAIVLLAVLSLLKWSWKSESSLFFWWGAGSGLLIVFAPEDNYLQSWYQLPLAAPAAALAGIAADWISSRGREILQSCTLIGALTGAAFGLIGYQSFSFVRDYYRPVAEPLRAAGTAIDRLLPRDALVLFASWGDPTTVYYSRRHGWLFYEHLVAPTNGAEAITMLEMRRRQGAAYFVITKLEEELRWPPYSSFWAYLNIHFSKISLTPEFAIFDLGVAEHQ